MLKTFTSVVTCAYICAWSADAAVAATQMATVAGGRFTPLFKSGAVDLPAQSIEVGSFQLDIAPVTNEEFAAFLKAKPQWQRDKVSRLFADEHFLSHWTDLSHANLKQPVVQVSWHAAKAYCAWAEKRLPTDLEWQFAAYEGDANFAERLTAWYSKPSSEPLPDVALTQPNRFGLYGLYGPIWEWVGDFNSLLVEDDSRSGGGANSGKFCGAGAFTATEARNYIGFMRAAYLSSLKANYTTSSLGFRCARDLKKGNP